MPFVARKHYCAPQVGVGVDDLAQGGRKDLGVRVSRLDPAYHLLEALDLGGDILAARLGAFDAEAELEILLIADENIGIRGYLGEYGVQLALPALPERIAVIEVKRNRRAVLLGFLCKLEAEFARLG